MAEEVVKVDDLLEFIRIQLKVEEDAAMRYKNHVSGIELQAYFRAMEDIQHKIEESKFQLKQKRSRKEND